MNELYADDGATPGVAAVGDLPGPHPSGMMPGDAVDQEATEPSDQEQRDYTQIVTSAMKFIHGPKSETVLRAMNNPRIPVHQAVGRFAAKLVTMIQNSAQSAGSELSPEALREAFAGEIIPDLLDLGQAGGLWDLSEAEMDEEVQNAALATAKLYGEGAKSRGKLPTQESRDFLQSQGVDLDGLVQEAGMTPVAAGVMQANRQTQQGGDLFNVGAAV